MAEDKLLVVLQKVETAYLLAKRIESINEKKSQPNMEEYAAQMLFQICNELQETKDKIRKIVVDSANWRVDEALIQARGEADICDNCAWREAMADKKDGQE